MTYTGLCIGGPRDGQYVTSPSPQFNAVKERLLPPEVSGFPLTGTSSAVADETMEHMTYVHSPWRAPKSDRTFDMWIPSTLSVAEALAMLQNTYHVAKARERRPG